MPLNMDTITVHPFAGTETLSDTHNPAQSATNLRVLPLHSLHKLRLFRTDSALSSRIRRIQPKETSRESSHRRRELPIMTHRFVEVLQISARQLPHLRVFISQRQELTPIRFPHRQRFPMLIHEIALRRTQRVPLRNSQRFSSEL